MQLGEVTDVDDLKHKPAKPAPAVHADDHPAPPQHPAFHALPAAGDPSTLPAMLGGHSLVSTNASTAKPAAPPTTAVKSNPVTDVNNATHAYDAANNSKKQLDAQLATELASVGPGLTDKQKVQYIQQFHAKHAAGYSAYDTAEKNLKNVVSRDAGALETMGEGSATANSSTACLAVDPRAGATTALAHGLDDLAGSPDGADAAKLGADLLKDPAHAKELFDGPGGAQMKLAMGHVVEEGLPKLAVETLTNQRGGGAADDQTKQQILATTQTFMQSADLFDGGRDAKAQLDELHFFMHPDANLEKQEHSAQASLAKYQAIANDKSLTQDARDKAAIQVKRFTTREHNLDEALDEKKLKKLEVLEHDATTGSSGALKKGIGALALALFAEDPQASATGIAQMLGMAAPGAEVRGMEITRGALSGLSLADRFVPGLGVLASGAALYDDAHKGTPGGYVSAAGDALSLAGSVMETVGVGSVVGVPVAAVGAIVDAIGTGVTMTGGAVDFVRGLVQGHPETPADEAHGILDQMFASDHSDPNGVQALGLSNASPYTSADLKALQLSPAQVRDFAGQYPALMGSPKAIAQTMALAKKLNIPAQDLGKMLDVLAQKYGWMPASGNNVARGQDAEDELDRYVTYHSSGPTIGPQQSPDAGAQRVVAGDNPFQVNTQADGFAGLEALLRPLEKR